jgi:gliding motility-associated-like protein
MKVKTGIILLFFFLLYFTKSAECQGFTTKGTDFWIAFMENLIHEDTMHTDRMKVYITTDNLPASGVVSVPLKNWFVNYTVAPNSTTEIVIPSDSVMCTETDSIENKGVHITSDNPVSVYQLNYAQYTSDANICIPTLSLGKKYRVTTYNAASASLAWTEVSVSQLCVVAAYDSTVIRIVPKCNTMGMHGANTPFTIMLNKGQVYPIKAYPSSSYSLTGTLIEIDTTVSDNCKTFAVFSGNLCGFVPGDSCCCNHICEQMMPISTWGKQYITVPLKTRASDVFRVVGQQNGTIFTINGGPPHGLNAGGFYEFDVNSPAFIDSNYPVSVAQFSKSAGTDGNEDSDPFMIMLNPLEQKIRRVVFNSFVTSIISAYYLNVVTKTAYTNLVELDGVGIASQFSPVVGNPLYSYAQITVSQGNHLLSSDSGMIANVYGYGWYETYGYIAGATVNNLTMSINVATPTATYKYYDLTDTICRLTPLTFIATISPFINNYSWNFGDGTPVVQGQSVTHSFAGPGKYTIHFYYQKAGICGLDSIIWDIHIKCCNESPSISGLPSLCEGGNIEISDTSTFNPNASYNWNFGNGNILSGNGQGPWVVNWNSSGNDTVWVVVDEPGCSSDSTWFAVEINPIPDATFAVHSPLCTGESGSVTYTGNASPTANYQWNFDGGHIINGSGPGPYLVSVNNSGTLLFSLTVTENGCTNADTMPVTVYPAPQAQFTPDPKIAFFGEPLVNFYDNSLNTSSWFWNFGDPGSGSSNFSNLASPSHNYYNQGNFTVWLVATSPDGCTDSTSQTVQVTDLNTFYIANAFTPNDNDINDIFQPYSTGMTYTLYIFDRWGEMLFEGINQGWDGKYQGEYVKQDIYTYLVLYTFKGEKPKKAAGRVAVLR